LEKIDQAEVSPISALKGLITPLMQSQLVIPQLILNLFAVSITTCSKLFKVLAPGNKVWPRLNAQAGNQTASWLFDTEVTITFMNSRSFNLAFVEQTPKKISTAQSCVAASGNAMNSLGANEVGLWIKGKKLPTL
jgi:hypothetical protein